MLQAPVSQREGSEPDAGPQAALPEPPVRQYEPVAGIFWDSPTLEQLARAQNVKPLTDVEALFGTWPGDEDDGFEAAVDELRYPAGANSFPVDRQMRKFYLSRTLARRSGSCKLET